MTEEKPIPSVRPTRRWKEMHCENYINSGGARGYIMDLSTMGGHKFTTHCLIRHTGRKSGSPQLQDRFGLCEVDPYVFEIRMITPREIDNAGTWPGNGLG
jgi:hypothetical protein